jgi:hypothetical protein
MAGTGRVPGVLAGGGPVLPTVSPKASEVSPGASGVRDGTSGAVLGTGRSGRPAGESAERFPLPGRTIPRCASRVVSAGLERPGAGSAARSGSDGLAGGIFRKGCPAGRVKPRPAQQAESCRPGIPKGAFGNSWTTLRSTPAQNDQHGLACHHCGCKHFRVIYARSAWGGRVARRCECWHCGKRMTTREGSGAA